MQKNWLLVLPFILGLVLLGVSLYHSYPISVVSSNDFVFNHIDVLYWFSLALLLASMFLMAMATKNHVLKWMLSIGIVLTFFSVVYFYSMIPTSDSQFFRGLIEYFTKTKDLNPAQANHSYYQWPAFFVLSNVVTSVTGLSLPNYEFILYGIIGFLLASSLYIYATKKHKLDGFLVVTAFFLSLTYFMDYQAVPFSLALGLLFLLFMLESSKRTAGLVIAIIILYITILFTHLFVPVFFVLYLFIRSLLEKKRKARSLYGYLFIFAVVGYAVVELTLARFSFAGLIISITQAPPQYAYIISQTIASSSGTAPINELAQVLSRAVTIAAVISCVAGSLLLLLKRKMRLFDLAIFTTGLVYTVLGLVLNTLGERALVILFIPFALGAAYIAQNKFRKVVLSIFLILIVLYAFIPLHLSFNTEIQFQTTETYVADNFFLDHYNWNNPGLTVADFRTNNYLTAKLPVNQYIQPMLAADEHADGLLYTPQFVGLEIGNYSSMQNLSQGQKLDVLYNDGFSFILINANR
jgi:hypothetical protein